MFRWFRRGPNHLAQRRLEMNRLLADYSIYNPPHRQSPNFRRQADSPEYRQLLREFTERGRENLAYFMDQRVVRLAALRCFLAKFSVNMTLDDSGLAAVSAWCPRNCGSLAANLRSPTTRQIFFQHLAPWTEEWRGMNVIFDLGVFLGECLIARNNRLHWAYHPGTSDDGSANHSGYAVEGFTRRRDHLDPPGYIYAVCGNDEVYIQMGEAGHHLRPHSLVEVIRDFASR